MGFCLKCKLDPCQCESWPDAPSNSSFPEHMNSKSEKSIEEVLSKETIDLIDKIIESGSQEPPSEVEVVEDDKEQSGESLSPLSISSKFGWIKGRYSWGIRVDFRPCSVGGMTDVYAANIVDVQDVGWRGCSSGTSWYKSVIRYRT